MATTFATAKAALDEISNRLITDNKRMQSAKESVAAALADLTAMGTAYASIVADIDAALASAPTNAAYMTMKAEKDLLVAEFTAAKSRATTMNTAIQGI
jgi:hypothetical protein